MRDANLPWALGDIDLGDDVLEVGPGYGATTDVLGERLSSLTAIEIDQELAAMLKERFAGSAAVTIVVGDATALTSPTAGSAAQPALPCSTTWRPESCRIDCSQRRFVFSDQAASWWPETAWPVPSLLRATRAIPTTRSTRISCRTAWCQSGSKASRSRRTTSVGRPRPLRRNRTGRSGLHSRRSGHSWHIKNCPDR